MITSSVQLKSKIKNLSGGNSEKAQELIRNYMMERFLERISLSEFSDQFILKGGMLVASMAGLDLRATMDIDTTVRALPLNLSDTHKIIDNIASISIADNITFEVITGERIMDEFDYPGVRFHMMAHLDKLRQPIKIDISTDDVITPAAIKRKYRLMFEDRTIELLSYPIETLFAEKLETILARGLANSRMRDFYDLYVLRNYTDEKLDFNILSRAVLATAVKRNTANMLNYRSEILDAIQGSDTMHRQWENYRMGSVYVGNISWYDVTESVKLLFEKI